MLSSGYLIDGAILLLLKLVFWRQGMEIETPQSRIRSVLLLRDNASYFDPLQEEYRGGPVLVTLICAFLHFFSEIYMIQSFCFGLKASINQGVLSALLNCSVPLIMAVSYFVLRSRTSLADYLGSGLIIGGAIVLTVGNDSRTVIMAIAFRKLHDKV